MRDATRHDCRATRITVFIIGIVSLAVVRISVQQQAPTAEAGTASSSAPDALQRHARVAPANPVGGRYLTRYTLPADVPFAHKQAGDDTTYYVEGDGRHLAAIGGDGVVLWREDLFEQASLEPYRVDEPQIAWLGNASQQMVRGLPGDYIAVQYNSTQFGIVDTATGEFTFLGQD